MYSQSDVARLRHIQRLIQDLGVNLAGVEVIIRMNERVRKMEEEMELLRVEMEQLETSGNRRREITVKETERERTGVAMRKLEEDVKRCEILILTLCLFLPF